MAKVYIYLLWRQCVHARCVFSDILAVDYSTFFFFFIYFYTHLHDLPYSSLYVLQMYYNQTKIGQVQS